MSLRPSLGPHHLKLSDIPDESLQYHHREPFRSQATSHSPERKGKVGILPATCPRIRSGLDRESRLAAGSWDSECEAWFEHELAGSALLRVYARIYGFAPMLEPSPEADGLHCYL